MKKTKFSIIIPVYNVEKYIEDCLESVTNQTYKNYEVLIINDGSTDNSRKIIEKYKKNKNIKIIDQKNQGLSSARNNGVTHAKGDYILFLDSDDYLEKKALEILEKNIKDEDVIRFQTKEIDESKNIIKELKEQTFNNLKGTLAFETIVKFHYVENAWLYCYKTSFYKDNEFTFKENYYHEDFGLTPIILMKANKVSSINDCLYNYRQRKNSIMNSKYIKKSQKKCNDFYKLGIYNIELILNSKVKNKEIFLSYIANSMIIKGKELPKDYRDAYYQKLRKNNIFNFMQKNTLKRKLKWLLAKYQYNLYLKVI